MIECSTMFGRIPLNFISHHGGMNDISHTFHIHLKGVKHSVFRLSLFLFVIRYIMMDTADIAAGNASKPSITALASTNRNKATHESIKITQHDETHKSQYTKRRRKRPSLLRRQSSLILTHIQSSLPATPTTWALLCLSASSAVLQRELWLQKALSSAPDVFCNLYSNEKMQRIYDKLSTNGGVFARRVVPTLFLGTRGVISSMAAYALPAVKGHTIQTRRVREVMTMGADGAKIVLDWEVPLHNDGDTINCKANRVANIDLPVVLLVHGMNNDSSFGYIRSMMKTATSRDWIAVCMNLRGQDWLGEVQNTTPRGVS